MKIMKSYRQWIPVIVFPLLAVSGILLWFFNAAMVEIFKIHWLALLGALILAFGPWGKRRLAVDAQELPSTSTWLWLAKIFFLQLSFSAVFLGVSVVCGQAAPVLTTPHPEIFQQTMTALLVHEGLFPWAFFALTAVAFGYYAYCRRQDADFAMTLNRLAQHPTVRVIVNFIARFVTIYAIGSSVALISLLWAGAFTTPPIITGFFWTPVLVASLLLLLSMTPFARRQLKKSLNKEIPVMLVVFSWTVFLAVAIWLLNGFLAPITNTAMAAPSLLNHWMKMPWENLWLIFANSAWMLWMPLAGVTLARISRGRRIREMVPAILILPFTGGLVLFFTQNYHWTISPIAVVFISGAGLLGVLMLIFQQKAIPSFILAALPAEDHYKFRSYRSTVIKIMPAAAAFLFLYLPGGMAVTHFLFFFFALPILAAALVNSIKQGLRER